MVAHNLSEIVQKLRTVLLADGDLVALLGGADAIYVGRPHTKPAYPIIVLSMTASNPQGDGGFTGVWRPDLTLDLIAPGSIYPQLAIDGYLQENWSIPANRTASIESDNFSVDLLRHVNTMDSLEIRMTREDEPLLLIPSLWTSRISVRPE